MMGGELLAGKAFEAATSEKAQGLIKGLFGKAFEETGEMIADQVRLRRFKNQIKIFEKAKKYLSDSKLETEKLNLKVLAPLIEYSSYEEDENLQGKWAKLIKNILTRSISVVMQQNAIEILRKISNEEAILLDYVYKQLTKKRIKSADDYNKRKSAHESEALPEQYSIDWYSFYIQGLGATLKQETSSIEVQISNLVALGTLRFDIQVKVDSLVISENTYPTDADVNVTDYESVRLTKLGYLFVEMCNA